MALLAIVPRGRHLSRPLDSVGRLLMGRRSLGQLDIFCPSDIRADKMIEYQSSFYISENRGLKRGEGRGQIENGPKKALHATEMLNALTGSRATL